MIARNIVNSSVYENNGHFYLKTFLLDSTTNNNGVAIAGEAIAKHVEKFIGAPLLLTNETFHPPEFDGYIEGQNHQVNIDTYRKLQEPYIIGHVVDVQKGDRSLELAAREEWNAVIEITDKNAIQLFKEGRIPRYVSPSIYKLGTNTNGSIIDFEPVHIAIVDDPAYGAKANVRATCTGNLVGCTHRLLMQSSTNNNNQVQEITQKLDKIESAVETISEQVKDFKQWKDSYQVNTDLKKYLKRLDEVDKLLSFSGIK